MTATHPSDRELEDFLLGKLIDSDHFAVDSHLVECGECGERALHAPGQDTLTELLASARTRANSVRLSAVTPMLTGSETPPLFTPTLAWEGSDSAPITPSDVPASLANHPKYRVVRRLGIGGMGTVWLAEHTVMNRMVAVKVIRPDLLARPGAAGRFLREVRAAAKLHHRNIVTAFDAEQAGDSCLLVMEYVDGKTLADLVQSGPMPVSEACLAIRDAARGLAHAHAAGLVHRDVKPHNLIQAVDGTVQVLDFGLTGVASGEIVAANGDGLTGAGMVVGTPAYIAPEQIVDPHAADARADIYGLGCTMYHLLSGKPPVSDGSIAEILAFQQTREPEPIPGLPEGLLEVLAKMIAKRPEDRYQSATEVVVALDAYCQAPVSRDTRAERGRWPLRWLAMAAGILLVAAAAVVFKIQRDNQEITIATDDADIEVVMKRKGEVLRVIDKKSGQTWEIDTATNQIGIADQPNGLTLVLQEKEAVVLRRRGDKDGKPVFTVSRTPRVVPMPAADTIGKVRQLAEHREAVFAVAVSRDGKHILSGGGDNPAGDCDLRLLDAVTGKEMRRLEGHRDSVHSVAFSGDGRRAISSGSDRTLRLWNVETGKQLTRFDEHPGVVFSAAISPDGCQALAGVAESTTGQLWLWNLESEKIVKKISVPGQVFSVAFLPVGRQALSGDHTGVLRLWDLETGKELKAFQGHAGWVLGISVSPNAKQVLTSSTDGTVRLWDMEKGSELKLFEGHKGAVTRVAFAPDGRRALSCGMDKTVRLWDVETGKELERFAGHSDRVNAVAFLADGRQAVTVSSDKTVRQWRIPDLATPQPFVILAKDAQAERQIATLADAIAAAKSGDTIEIRGNGPFATAPLVIEKKALTLRAGTGFRPVIQLAPEGEKTNAPLVKTDAALVLEGIEFRLGEGNPFKVGPNPTLLYSVNAPVYAANCRFVMVRQGPYSVVVQPDGSPSVVLRNCEFLILGHHTAVNWTYPSGGRLVMENCVHVGNVLARVYCRDDQPVSVQLTHNTHATYGSLFEVSLVNPPDFSRREKSIELDVSENAVQGDWLGMCSQNTAISKEQVRNLLPRLIRWRDRNNLYSPRLGMVGHWHMGQLGDPALTNTTTVAEWEKFWGLADTKTRFAEALRFAGDNRTKDIRAKMADGPEKVTPTDFRLAKGSPGQGAGKDGKDLGADVDLVGPGDAYDRWKKTPAYREWQAIHSANWQLMPPEAKSKSTKVSNAEIERLVDPSTSKGNALPVALLEQEGLAAFRFGKWLLVFQGVICDSKGTGIAGLSAFNYPIAEGKGEGVVDFGKPPAPEVSQKWDSKANEISVNNVRFKMEGKGTRLVFADRTYEAGDQVQTIVVARNGTTSLVPLATPKK